MLNYSAVKNAYLFTRPFRWARIEGMVESNIVDKLRAGFPSEYLIRSEKSSGGDKTYRFNILPLVILGEQLPIMSTISEVWKEFTKSLLSKRYKRSISNLIGVDLDQCKLNIGIYSYGPGDGISPHTDHLGKILTHVFYFNRCWEAGWGGAMQILCSQDRRDLYEEILPSSNCSIIIVREDNSWHSVSNVENTSLEPRVSVQVEFWKPENYRALYSDSPTAGSKSTNDAA